MNERENSHYSFRNYAYPERWASYYYQLREIMASSPRFLLYVGAGDSVVPSYLKRHSAIGCTTLDIDEKQKPDVVGSVDRMPFKDRSFDAVCCFEVLEHLPFERFEPSLRELARVSKKAVLLSLPHFGPPVKFSVKLPLLPELRFMWKIPYRPAHAAGGEHQWEIGKRGHAPARIRGLLRRHFSIEREFVPFDAPYHHFFVLAKKP